MASDDEMEGEHAQSEIARRLARLRKVTLDAAQKREHIPQPLFWSLFHAELDELRRQKELLRVVDSLFK